MPSARGAERELLRIIGLSGILYANGPRLKSARPEAFS